MKTYHEYFLASLASFNTARRVLGQGECQTPSGRVCPVCYRSRMTYAEEAIIKKSALQNFWTEHFPDVPLQKLVQSPLGDGYRAVSKRKAFYFRNGIRLGLIDAKERGDSSCVEVQRCLIEPAEHALIYALAQEKLCKPYAFPLADELVHVIIKGNYQEQTLIFSVRSITPAIIKAANTLSKSLSHEMKSIAGLFLYEDTSDSGYYLGVKGSGPAPKFKKLFGNSELFLRCGEKSFLYHPLSFSQVNESIIMTMVDTARRLLQPTPQSILFDLYCGYGLFSLNMSSEVKSITGIELSPHSIESALSNAKRQHVTNARFFKQDINSDSVFKSLQRCGPNDLVLLDPPRKGTAEGVIESIAAYKPLRVLHIFCNIDLIPSEIEQWKKGGYSIAEAIPLDNFPGTEEVEVMVLLKRD